MQKLPGWSQLLSTYQERVSLPTAKLALQDAAVMYSLQQLQEDVRANPARWRDGTGNTRRGERASIDRFQDKGGGRGARERRTVGLDRCMGWRRVVAESIRTYRSGEEA